MLRWAIQFSCVTIVQRRWDDFILNLRRNVLADPRKLSLIYRPARKFRAPLWFKRFPSTVLLTNSYAREHFIFTGRFLTSIFCKVFPFIFRVNASFIVWSGSQRISLQKTQKSWFIFYKYITLSRIHLLRSNVAAGHAIQINYFL